MNTEDLVKKVNACEIDDPSRRGWPLGRWKDRVKEYMSERGVTRGEVLEQARREYMSERGVTRGEGLEQARRECLDMERWRIFCHDHSLGGDIHGGSKASEV